jgi:8-oxo-(d)GTP phosphatase
VTRVLRAAGGLVVRRTPKGKIKILLAHRPSYDDWGLPKGKMDEGESPEETAIREVLEETGFRCRIVAPIGASRHQVGGRPKDVTWFLMRPLPDSPGFEKNTEIDQIRWLGPKEARKLADYENDRKLIAETDLKRLTRSGTIRLLRHFTAGDREHWKGDDRDRPLTKKGRAQAASIARSLQESGIERVISSPYARCMQSVAPLAKRIGSVVEVDERFAEGADVAAARAFLDELAGDNVVICSHGDVIPGLLRLLQREGLDVKSPLRYAKGSMWEIDVDGGKPTRARYLPPLRP